ncbi:hypothetical protein [Sodalis ligni]|uniref:Uncharacterized protein n=1 Tax=Sodalis ligni TaxID=2697027 RepID=A0A4V2Q3I3_9GAMM|nr:hypothetical protein [Sodalis ligni]TCL06868.1 hypothetical protein EZJ58_5165 [Sodalis ligni]
MKLPVQMQTIDIQTGTVEKTETVGFQIMPKREGTCQECGRQHLDEDPHDAQSLHYQYTFYAREGRWPTWADALAHCPVDTRNLWIKELAKHGIDVVGTKQGGAQ